MRLCVFVRSGTGGCSNFEVAITVRKRTATDHRDARRNRDRFQMTTVIERTVSNRGNATGKRIRGFLFPPWITNEPCCVFTIVV